MVGDPAVFQFDPVKLFILQATTACNLNCRYCYIPAQTRAVQQLMPVDVLHKALDRLIEYGRLDPHLNFLWHAGEPLTAPLAFYEQALTLIEDRLSGHPCTSHVSPQHSLQTNATLITPAHCDFFKRFNVQVGVSLDGPAILHNANRTDRQGDGSFAAVMRGVALLKAYEVPFGVTTVITPALLEHADALFEFYEAHQLTHLAFNVERSSVQRRSSLAIQDIRTRYRSFLARFWQRVKQSPEPFVIRDLLHLMYHLYPASQDGPDRAQFFYDRTSPFNGITVDQRGDTSFFTYDLYHIEPTPGEHPFVFGNVFDRAFQDMMAQPRAHAVWREILTGKRACEQQCPYYFCCGGNAPGYKYEEHGTFEATETLYCQLSYQVPTDLLLEDLERALPR